MLLCMDDAVHCSFWLLFFFLIAIYVVFFFRFRDCNPRSHHYALLFLPVLTWLQNDFLLLIFNRFNKNPDARNVSICRPLSAVSRTIEQRLGRSLPLKPPQVLNCNFRKHKRHTHTHTPFAREIQFEPSAKRRIDPLGFVFVTEVFVLNKRKLLVSGVCWLLVSGRGRESVAIRVTLFCLEQRFCGGPLQARACTFKSSRRLKRSGWQPYSDIAYVRSTFHV